MSAEGNLIFYDFGMMCETAKSKDDLLDVFFGIYEKDTNKACTHADGEQASLFWLLDPPAASGSSLQDKL